MKLYLAGPLFTAAEIAFNVRLKELLVKAGFEVWLPQEHKPKEITSAAIFQMDVSGIDWCDVVVANMDGPDPDSGTCWECGYAYKKKRIILYRTDFRKAGDEGMSPFNLMMSQSADHTLLLPWASVEKVGDEIVALLGQVTKR